MTSLRHWIDSLPTPAKLLFLLSAALLPIGGLLVYTATDTLRGADLSARLEARADATALADGVDRLIARNALALRVAANAALAEGSSPESCQRASRTLAIAPAVARDFELEDSNGRPICVIGDYRAGVEGPTVAPGDIRTWIGSDGASLMIRTGVARGSATTRLPLGKLSDVAFDSETLLSARLRDSRTVLPLSIGNIERRENERTLRIDEPLAGNRLTLETVSRLPALSRADKASIFLPLLMWALAAILSWALVHRLLIRPLRRLQKNVADFAPGDDPSRLAGGPGTASEIRDLADTLAGALDRIDAGEKKMAEALEGQRRLVREVHHRVKNNLQVVASLLSIHGRSATGAEGRAAYAAIGRRVDALSVVHRNHFAELEDNQGIQLRPLLTELASGLRATAAKDSPFLIDLELEPSSTTQDTAVAVAFFVTELAEFAMVAKEPKPVEITLRRTSELTARLTVSSQALFEESEPSGERRQFERIVEAIARQLRSPLERTMGRYAVEIAIFPDR